MSAVVHGQSWDRPYLELLYLVLPTRPQTWPPMQEQQGLLGLGIDIDIVCERSKSGLHHPCAAKVRFIRRSISTWVSWARLMAGQVTIFFG